MRGNGTGTITRRRRPSGSVTKALLFWNGPTNSTVPTANAAVTFTGTLITGTNIGFASSNCWPAFANSQSYRADVTSLVSGNGTYSLANFTKVDADINGVALIVFYNDGNSSNDRNYVMFNGNDSNVASTFDPAAWDQTIAGVPYSGRQREHRLRRLGRPDVRRPGRHGERDHRRGRPRHLPGRLTPGGPFNASGSLWDVKSFTIPSGCSRQARTTST